MRTILKYEVQNTDRPVIVMPDGANILAVGMQNDNMFLWADVDTDNGERRYELRVIGTGHPVPFGMTYVNTVFQGPFVWHIYK